MTDIDIVAELRRLYKAVPQGEWALEPYAEFTSWWMGYDIRIGPNTGDVIVGADRALLGYNEREIGNLIVAMHEALPALLDAVEALRWYADEENYDPESGAPGQWENASCEPGQPPEWDFEPDEGERARAALAALKRSGEG